MCLVQAVELSNLVVREACHNLRGFVSGKPSGAGVIVAAKNERAFGVVALHVAKLPLPDRTSKLENMVAMDIRERVLELVELLVYVVRTAVTLIGNLLGVAADQNLAAQQRGWVRTRNSDSQSQLLADVWRIVAVNRADVTKAEFVHQIRADGARIACRNSSGMIDVVAGAES